MNNMITGGIYSTGYQGNPRKMLHLIFAKNQILGPNLTFFSPGYFIWIFSHLKLCDPQLQVAVLKKENNTCDKFVRKLYAKM